MQVFHFLAEVHCVNGSFLEGAAIQLKPRLKLHLDLLHVEIHEEAPGLEIDPLLELFAAFSPDSPNGDGADPF
jgi:hypothetical protein